MATPNYWSTAHIQFYDQLYRKISRRGVKEFLALCSALKLYSLQFEEVPVTPPGGSLAGQTHVRRAEK